MLDENGKKVEESTYIDDGHGTITESKLNLRNNHETLKIDCIADNKITWVEKSNDFGSTIVK